MHFFWEILKGSVSLIGHGDPFLYRVIWFTIQVAVVSTAIAAVIGLPIGIALGLGRFPGRGLLQALANASLGLPPVLVGLFLFLIFVPQGPLGGLYLNITKPAVFIAQTVLALPYVIALSAAAIQGVAPGLVAQARLLRAGRVQLGALALREARVGVIAALLAALGTGLSEVAAIAIVGGNVYGFDQTLASSGLYYANAARWEEAMATGIVLLVLILILMGALSLVQHRSGPIRMRFATARATTDGAT